MLCRILRLLGFHKPRGLSQAEAPKAEAKAPGPEPHAESAPTGTPPEADRQDGLLSPAATPPSQPQIFTPAATQVREIEVVIGLDFGTSCTKIAARLPYEAGQPTYALPVPPGRQAESHPYLWRSELWLAPDGAFSLDPVPEGEHLTQLKWALMESADLGATSGPQPSPIEAAAAFLALQIRRTRHWLAQKRPDLTSPDYRLRWSWHVGFPAASLDDSGRCWRYKICVVAALHLARGAKPLLLADVREATWRASRAPGAILQDAGAALLPEIAAAVADFAHSARHENGLYAMIDVGAATFDCCTFNLVRPRDGTIACPIFVADVALLGVEPWRACSDDLSEAEAFGDKLNRCARTVIWTTRKCRHPGSPRWSEGLPLFLIGGGAASRPHRKCAETLTPWIRHHLGIDKYPKAGIPIIPLPMPAILDYQGDVSDAHRLAVAVGLSRPADEIPGVELPGTIPDWDKPRQKLQPESVGKEQT